MQKMKKGVALALASVMVLGSSMTVFAAEGDTPAAPGGTGTVQGEGSSEGHLEKEKLNVVLPTVEAGTTPFSYTMDPERLIQETDGGKYAEDAVFPDEKDDTGVYFLTAPNTYANTSNTYQTVNKSSCDIKLTVDVQATQNTAKDITLVDAASTSTTAAELYLALKVGNDTQAVSSTKATVTKTISGTESNFETAVEEGKYVYREKADATTWKAMNIAMTGSVNKFAIADDTTAPTVDVTWSWAKAGETDTAATDQVDYSTAPADKAPSITKTEYDYDRTATFNIVTDFGAGDLAATSIKSVKIGASQTAFATDLTAACTISGNTITFPAGKVGTAAVGDKKYVQVTFDDDTAVVLTLTIIK